MKFLVHIIRAVEVEAESPRAAKAAALRVAGGGYASDVYAIHPEPVEIAAQCEGCDAFATEADDMAALGWRFDPEDGCYTCPDCAAKLDAEVLARVAATGGVPILWRGLLGGAP